MTETSSERCAECAELAQAENDHCFAHMTTSERQAVIASADSETRTAAAQAWARHGMVKDGAASLPSGSAALICPHCQTQGHVTTRRLKVKRGISGGKATGAVLTAGISLLGTGLSRKEQVTQMRCGQCGTVWQV